MNAADPSALVLRPAEAADWPAIWPFFRLIVEAGESYPYPSDMPEPEARVVWMEAPAATYVAERGGQVVGSYYIKLNQLGRGSHVCNCGYMVDPAARGGGVATAMCLHSQDEARRLGFLAMQYNLVVSTNEAAVHLWRKLGFEEVGVLPRAFDHARLGLVDALVMYRWLG
jgi:L-amino acid N-acyltransferase YncA